MAPNNPGNGRGGNCSGGSGGSHPLQEHGHRRGGQQLRFEQHLQGQRLLLPRRHPGSSRLHQQLPRRLTCWPRHTSGEEAPSPVLGTDAWRAELPSVKNPELCRCRPKRPSDLGGRTELHRSGGEGAIAAPRLREGSWSSLASARAASPSFLRRVTPPRAGRLNPLHERAPQLRSEGLSRCRHRRTLVLIVQGALP